MKIVERQVGDVVILDLHGKILIGEGDDALREAVTKLSDSGKTKILLNLADVPYVDSAGLGEIVRTYTTVSRKGASPARSTGSRPIRVGKPPRLSSICPGNSRWRSGSCSSSPWRRTSARGSSRSASNR